MDAQTVPTSGHDPVRAVPLRSIITVKELDMVKIKAIASSSFRVRLEAIEEHARSVG
jgi:hypothetical protein